MYIEIRTDNFVGNIDRNPDTCPRCHSKIAAIPQHSTTNAVGTGLTPLQIVYLCPNTACHKLFLATFTRPAARSTNSIYLLRDVRPRDVDQREFSKIVSDNYPDFIAIFNEAFAAEQHGLSQICGMGYRKALEFLIKDYLINQSPEDRHDLEEKWLGRCISENIENENIKIVASRATWLGNDESHYIRKWVDKDLNEMKSMLNLTLAWIETEELTRQALAEMPDPKTNAAPK